MREIHRVLVPGGRLYLADVFLGNDLKESERSDVSLWAGCVAGALLETEIADIAREAGFEECSVIETFNSFQGSRVERDVSPVINVHGANVFARKGKAS
jgi:hypothetical protein